VLWVATNLRAVSTMCFDWDAAQLSLATIEYNLADHQPHPPGYPLWVVSLKPLVPITGGAPLAQTVLDILFTLAALYFFHRLARECCGEQTAGTLVILLAFSPVVQLYAFAQSTYPVDLLASSLLGWLAYRMWRGEKWALWAAFPTAAVLMGFRPCGMILLWPLLAGATVRGFGRRPLVLVPPLAVAVVLGLAWFWPLINSTGGYSSWFQMSSDLFRATSGATSVFFAPAEVGPPIVGRLTVILVVALLPLAGLVLRWRGKMPLPWRFLVLWTLPGLLFVYLIHFAKPGYLLLVLPPLFLIMGAARPSRRTLLIGFLAAELVVLLPYDRLPSNRLTRALEVATPHAAVSAARANRALRKQVKLLQPSRIICTAPFQNAPPNRRSVEYDFRELAGAGAPAHLTAAGSRGPEGTQLVFEGEDYALWR